MSDSVSSHLVVGCLLGISKATLCYRLPTRLRPRDCAGQRLGTIVVLRLVLGDLLGMMARCTVILEQAEM